MSERQVLVRISPLGDVKVEAEGFVGEGCVAATQAIEQSLGGNVKNRQFKPEYDQQPADGQGQTQDLTF
jgi:hypothetical protein